MTEEKAKKAREEEENWKFLHQHGMPQRCPSHKFNT
jgi:hypothetical protein